MSDRHNRTKTASVGKTASAGTIKYFDYSLLFIILFLTGFGLVMIYSASAYDATTQNLNEDYYLMHQAFAAALGLVGMFLSPTSHIILGTVCGNRLCGFPDFDCTRAVAAGRRGQRCKKVAESRYVDSACGDRKAGDDSVSGDVYLQDGKKHSDVERLFDGYWSFPAARFFVSGKSPTT